MSKRVVLINDRITIGIQIRNTDSEAAQISGVESPIKVKDSGISPCSFEDEDILIYAKHFMVPLLVIHNGLIISS